jgi:hypothetical protein
VPDIFFPIIYVNMCIYARIMRRIFTNYFTGLLPFIQSSMGWQWNGNMKGRSALLGQNGIIDKIPDPLLPLLPTREERISLVF